MSSKALAAAIGLTVLLVAAVAFAVAGGAAPGPSAEDIPAISTGRMPDAPITTTSVTIDPPGTIESPAVIEPAVIIEPPITGDPFIQNDPFATGGAGGKPDTDADHDREVIKPELRDDDDDDHETDDERPSGESSSQESAHPAGETTED